MERRTSAEIEDFNKSILSVLPKAKTKAMPIAAIAKALDREVDHALSSGLTKLRNAGKVLTLGERAKMVYYKK